MPNLPTLTVTDAQSARLMRAFGTPEAYKAWLKQALINEVLDRETRGTTELPE